MLSLQRKNHGAQKCSHTLITCMPLEKDTNSRHSLRLHRHIRNGAYSACRFLGSEPFIDAIQQSWASMLHTRRLNGHNQSSAYIFKCF